ncbi:helicase [Candidatus Bathyarchaeota archaeon ex4484_205]|nr:MAG: helicase [Candidatus Bathyarchaeota archaeon ex4484_205]
MEIREGSLIEGPLWNEPVRVEKVERIGRFLRIVGVTSNTRVPVDQILTEDQFSLIRPVEDRLDFSSPGEEVFLSLEAIRFRCASLFDPLLAMNTSKIDPLPHQIEAVYGYVLKLPRIRFLIADDAGAGKTIMAGLIIKELKLRGLAKRILIVVPGHLKDQWRREMKEKFKEEFVLIDRGFVDSHYSENVWEKYDQVITSMDFAKRKERIPELLSANWDLVVVDEAHKMSAHVHGKKVSKTKRYKLGEVLSKNSEHLLFLTATPHSGDTESFRLFLDLLAKGFFATQEILEESVRSGDNPLFIRRRKEDLRDFEGRPLFPPRKVKTVTFSLSDGERRLYSDLSRYVTEQYNKSRSLRKDEKRRNVVFALIILQRRMASSTYALLKSLKRRKEKLEEIVKSGIVEHPTIPLEEDIEIEDYSEGERWEIESKLESLSASETIEELKKEIMAIDQLIEEAEEILKREREVKLEKLRKILESIGDEKIIVFTESRDTLEYLVEKIKSWGYSVNYIHGGMRLEERVKAEKVFKNETQVLVATEAAGEGINLQFCHLMVNYDLPWNPNRLEQRMGRIHRYGQQREVHIFNMVTKDTREGQVLSKLLEKLKEIEKAYGSDKVFDVIGEIIPGRRIEQLIVEAVTNSRTMDEILKELDFEVDEKYISEIKSKLGESLATEFIDYTRIREMEEKAREHRLIPEYVEEFFKRAFSKAGGEFTYRNGVMSIRKIPRVLKNISKEDWFIKRFGYLMDRYPKVTFDKEIAFKNPELEFVSFGHPLLEVVLEWVSREFSHLLKKGSVFLDPSGSLNGVIWFFEGEIRDGKGEVAGKRLFAIYDDGNSLREMDPSVIWDLVPASFNQEGDYIVEREREKVIEFAINLILEYKNELEKERERQCEIKKKYGVKSLEYLIGELEADIISLEARKEAGEEVDLPLRNKIMRKEEYEEALEELKREINMEKSLTISTPNLIGAILVRPILTRADEEVERIGMEIAMEYERSQGRYPEDVSHLNLGFDIRSRDEEGRVVRYIEVKARSEIGPVSLTPNEWFKARRFGDSYYLYIVTNARTSPELYVIRNPAESLEVEEKTEVVRFIVREEEWIRKGEKKLSGI